MTGIRCNWRAGLLALAVAWGLGPAWAVSWGQEATPTPSAHDPALEKEGEHKEGEHKAGEEGAGHAGENAYDLGHANAGPEQGSIVELKSEMALYSFIVFLLLLAIVTKFAWKPIMEGLANRENSIAAMIDEAKASAAAAQASLKQYEAKLASASEETRAMLAQARADAETAKDRIIAEAQAAAQKERDKSLADIRTAKETALREITQQSVDTAFALARKIVQKEIRPADHTALIKESLAQFPSKN